MKAVHVKILEGTFDLMAKDRKAFTISLLVVLVISAPYAFLVQPLLEREGINSVWYTIAMVAVIIGYLLSYLYIIQKRFNRQRLEFVVDGDCLSVMWRFGIYKRMSLPLNIRTEQVMEIINRYTNKPALMIELSDGKAKLSISEILSTKPADAKSLKIWQSEMISVNQGTVEKLVQELEIIQ